MRSIELKLNEIFRKIMCPVEMASTIVRSVSVVTLTHIITTDICHIYMYLLYIILQYENLLLEQ